MLSLDAVIAKQDARVRALLRTPYQPRTSEQRLFRTSPGDPLCGRQSETGYSYGCRCGGCRAAHAAYRRVRSQARTDAGPCAYCSVPSNGYYLCPSHRAQHAAKKRARKAVS